MLVEWVIANDTPANIVIILKHHTGQEDSKRNRHNHAKYNRLIPLMRDARFISKCWALHMYFLDVSAVLIWNYLLWYIVIWKLIMCAKIHYTLFIYYNIHLHERHHRYFNQPLSHVPPQKFWAIARNISLYTALTCRWDISSFIWNGNNEGLFSR